VNEGKVNFTSSELVVKLDETKFECVISPNVNVMDPTKVQKVKFSSKSGMSNFATAWGGGGKFWYMYVKRGKASVLVTLVLSP